MTPSDIFANGSRAGAPDLDWSQVRETVLMLQLSAAQIESAMKDSNSSVEVLSESFTAMAGYVQSMSATLNNLTGNGEAGAAKASLSGTADQVSGMLNHTIIAFQFYDKLVQRLAHVSHSLELLGSLVSDRTRLYNPDEWTILQDSIRAKFSTAEELVMFESVMAGVPVQEAIDRFVAERMAASNDIELF